ncbi:MAG: hypothetical protein KW788_05240 [Candidatus Doudnabacteria bacterium]|nr:hypothetical protein [Candidatus Doudnabacteria bacterium]
MTTDKWEETKEELARKFDIESEGTEDLLLEKEDGTHKVGTAEFFIFQSPFGRTKLVRETRPVIKYAASHRSAIADAEHDHDAPEFSYKIKVYKWVESDDEWKEIDGGSFAK